MFTAPQKLERPAVAHVIELFMLFSKLKADYSDDPLG